MGGCDAGLSNKGRASFREIYAGVQDVASDLDKRGFVMSGITSPARSGRRDAVVLIALIAGVACVAVFILSAALAISLWFVYVPAGVIAVIAGVISLWRRRARGLRGGSDRR